MEPEKVNISWAKVDSFVGNFNSSALTADRPCPVCKSTRSRVVMELNDFQFYADSREVPKRVNLHECQCLDCLALYLNPGYSKLGFRVLFAEADQSYGAPEGIVEEQVRWLTNRGLLRSSTKVFDVGCHDGRFLARLPKDVRKTGIDTDGPAVERGRLQFRTQGIEFILGDFETGQYDGTPDVITMFHVLEHLPRPVSALRKLRSIAQPSARLIIEVPILENASTNDIHGSFSAQHLTHFSRCSLQNCLAQGGWKSAEQSEQPNYNGYRILAVPCQLVDDIVVDQRDPEFLSKCLGSWNEAVRVVNHKLSRLEEISRYVIWGGGMHTEFLYQTTSFFKVNGDRAYVIVDNDPVKHGKTWRGIPIHPPSVLREVDWSKVQLVISSYASQPAIVRAALDWGVPEERMVRLYEEIRRY